MDINLLSIPGNPSDAGPESHETPKTWDEWLIDAEDELRSARRLSRDNRAVERKLRLEAIARAETFIEAARAEMEVA